MLVYRQGKERESVSNDYFVNILIEAAAHIRGGYRAKGVSCVWLDRAIGMHSE